MRINLVGAFIRNAPFGTEIAFQKGFRDLGGHQVTCIDTSQSDQKWDYEADATVVFKWIEGDNWKNLAQCRGKKIVYQPDDLRFGHIRDMMIEMRKFCDYALTFDADGAIASVISLGYKDAQKLLVTADDSLYRPLGLERDIDVSFIGSLTGGQNHSSRATMCSLIKDNFPEKKVFVGTNIYDIQKIVEIYNRSKVVVNHATDVGQPFGTGYGYQCRHFEVGMTQTCLLSNAVFDDDSVNEFFQFSSQLDFVDKLDYILGPSKPWTESGKEFRAEIMRAHSPIHRARQMVRFIEEINSR